MKQKKMTPRDLLDVDSAASITEGYSTPHTLSNREQDKNDHHWRARGLLQMQVKLLYSPDRKSLGSATLSRVSRRATLMMLNNALTYMTISLKRKGDSENG